MFVSREILEKEADVLNRVKNKTLKKLLFKELIVDACVFFGNDAVLVSRFLKKHLKSGFDEEKIKSVCLNVRKFLFG